MPFLVGGRQSEAANAHEGTIRPGAASLDDYLKNVSKLVADEVRRCVARLTGKAAGSFEALSDAARDDLVKRACAMARHDHYAALSGERHLISSKPRDVWGEITR